jgi:hypothetical protein
LAGRAEPADLAWCSLSIHHLQTDGKLRLMQALCASTGTMLMIYEPARLEDETRGGYLEPLPARQPAGLDHAQPH